MTFDLSQERDKWDDYYNSLTSAEEYDYLHKFGLEFANKVLELLPSGGRTLEMGSGAGWQSLALARTGKFQVSLLDFSTKALDFSRKLFEKENLSANFILADAFEAEKGDFDLVFNAGVIEHYNPKKQTALLRSMAARSQKFVLTLAPNQECAWYWLWRIQATANANWTFGKEAPAQDLSQVFSDANINFIGQAYMGQDWTESFIQVISGIDDTFREIALAVHRSLLLSQAQRSYLVASLGSVTPLDHSPAGWGLPAQSNPINTGDLLESISIALSHSVQEKALFKEHKLEKDSQINHLNSTIELLKNELIVQQEKSDQASRDHLAELEERDQAYQNNIEKLQQAQNAELESIKLNQNNLQQELIQKKQTIASLSGTLDEIYSSDAWKLVKSIWKTLSYIRSNRYYIRIEKIVRRLMRISTYPIETDLGPADSTMDNRKLSKQHDRFIAQTGAFPSFIHDYLKSPSKQRVILVQPTFFDFDGNNMFFGGAERYMIELSHLIEEMGYDPVLVQCGNDYWMRFYENLRVIGLKLEGRFDLLTQELEKINPTGALIIYSPFARASQMISIPGIGISHGIFWDHETFQTFPNSWQKTTKDLLQSIQVLQTIVSVDTNTINWLRTIDVKLANRCVYIPNFVDLNQFTPTTAEEDRLVVLYPRRLYGPRGFWLVAEILPELLDKYPQLDFHFVGKADAAEEAKVLEIKQTYPNRVQHQALLPNEMHKAYQQAHIAVIPTVNSEGTSLSCLEALACGLAVIATNVGGLPDLILDGYNGILIEPTSEDLKQAIEKLISDTTLRKRFAQAGRETAATFNLKRWRNQWKSILMAFLLSDAPIEIKKPRVVVFPYAPGIEWTGIKQRPHHLAKEFARSGFQVFWRNEYQRGHPQRGIHLIACDDDLYLEQPVLLIYYPFNYEQISEFSNPFVIFDVLDDVSIHFENNEEEGGKIASYYYDQLLERADIVTTSSRVLLGRLRKVRKDTIYLPNGVYLDHFNPTKSTIASELKALKKPIIGFHGSFATWVDSDLIFEISCLRPDYCFVFVGPVSVPDQVKRLETQKNIHFFDSVPYERISNYVKGFDVGILPFKLNTLTHAVRPLKVLEYLAMDKPVVATPIEELTDWPGVLLADDPDAFASQLDKALHTGGLLGDPDEITRFIKESTWPEVVRPLMSKLKLE